MGHSARATGRWAIIRTDERLGRMFYAGRPEIGGRRWTSDPADAVTFRQKRIAERNKQRGETVENLR